MIAQLVARGFRNLEDLEWSLGPGCHLLVGGTGAGKTSLLEAIYLASTTRSFRTRQLADCSRRVGAHSALAERASEIAAVAEPRGIVESDVEGDGESGVEGEIESRGFFVALDLLGEPRTRLEVGWDDVEGFRRAVNGKSGPLTEHLGRLPLLVWSSAEIETLIGGPDLRRRLLDRGVVSQRPETLDLYSRFQQTLRQKRRLLTDGLGGLEGWNEVLAPLASAVAIERSRYAQRLDSALAEALGRSGLRFPRLRIRYRSSPPEALEGEEALLAFLNTVAPRERESRRVLYGPHRDAVTCLWGDLEVRQVASAGERKAYGLLLLAGQAAVLREAGREPLLLLDDLDTELDRPTLEALWHTLGSAPQTFVSSNRPEVFSGLGADHRWRVEEGRLSGP